MTSVMRALPVLTVIAGTFAVPSIIRADALSKPTAAEARSHLTFGNRLYGIRSFEEAIAEYKAGAVIEPAPVFDYNLGQCFRQLGKYEDAIWHYQRFIVRGDPRGELLDAVNSFISQMKSELDKKAMTQPPIDSAPSSSVQHPSIQAANEPLREGHQAQWYHDRVGWGLAGAGVLGLTIGGGLLLSASHLYDQANSNPNQQEHNHLRDRADNRNLIGKIVGIGSVAIGMAGAIKLAIGPRHTSRTATLDISPTINGISLFGSF